MIKRILCLLFLVQLNSCWVPPYDADASNAVYLSQAMEELITIDLSKMQQNLHDVHLYFDSDQVFFQRFSFMVNHFSSNRYMLFNHHGGGYSFYSLILSENTYELEYLQHDFGTPWSPNLGRYSWTYWKDPVTDTFYPMVEMNIQNIPFDGFGPVLQLHYYDAATNSWLHDSDNETLDPNTGRYLFSSTSYFDFESQETRFYTLETFSDWNSNTNELYLRTYSLLHRNTLLVPFELEIILPDSFTNYDLFDDSRIAFITDSNTLYCSSYENYSSEHYKIVMDSTESSIERISNVDSSSILLTSLSDGSILYQGRVSSDSFYCTLLRPNGSVSKLQTGRLAYAGNYVKNGVQYLVFNQYFEIRGDGEEQRFVKILQIPAEGLVQLFD